MWGYSQTTGKLTKNGVVKAIGYSGFGKGKNNPSMQDVATLGPIPKGLWKMGNPYDSVNVGPFAIPLEMIKGNIFGRSAFRIHGDSKSNPGNASHGCIILPRNIREMIWASGDKELTVTD